MKAKKLFALLMALVMVCGCLCACSKEDASKQTKTTENSTQETTDTATEPQVVEPEVQTPVDIETDGGVVIVGKIGKDDRGWYIQPEAPLNITFEYFMDNPTVYTEVTRIQLFDPAVDGIEKSMYLDMTVTAGGKLTYYRDDFETMYLAVYTINLGKNVENSYAAPELMPPAEHENRYDPSQPLPDKMNMEISGDTYKYNAYMLSLETLEYMGNDFAWFYVDFVDAFLNYKTEVACSDKEFAEMLSTVIYDELPLYNACAEPFEFFKSYNAEKGTVTIKYTSDKATFEKIKEQFFASANEMLADAKTSQTDTEKAKNIYHAIATRMTYDYSALELAQRKDSYYAYLHKTGVCLTFANVYNQLLTRVGIDTTLAHCDYDATSGHIWSVVTLDGQQYFCDPTFELNYDNGNGYIYFGMNYADRTANGLGENGIRYGRYIMKPMDESMIAQQSLDK